MDLLQGGEEATRSAVTGDIAGSTPAPAAAPVVELDAFKARRLQERVNAIRIVDLEEGFVGREAVSYGEGNGRVAVFAHWEGEEIGIGLTADQARELGLALIGAAALATSEFRALVEQREEGGS